MIRRMAVRYYLYNKRLFKKYSFLLILCMVPLLVGGIRLFAKEESGIATVVLCLTDGEDELAARAVGELTEEEGVLRYLRCDKEEEARQMVAEGEADAAWIFTGDLSGSLKEAAAKKRVRPVVQVV